LCALLFLYLISGVPSDFRCLFAENLLSGVPSFLSMATVLLGLTAGVAFTAALLFSGFTTGVFVMDFAATGVAAVILVTGTTFGCILLGIDFVATCIFEGSVFFAWLVCAKLAALNPATARRTKITFFMVVILGYKIEQ
jgi:hypothetical protein